MSGIAQKEALYYKNAVQNFRIPICEQITALTAFLRMVGSKINKNEQELIELTIKSCCYTQKLIDMIEDIYSIDNKTFKLNYEDFNFLELLNEIFWEFEIILKTEKLKVRYINKENLTIHADKDKLKTALGACLLTLFNYCNKNEEILIELKKVKNNLVVKFSAKGRKIDNNELKTMYDKEKIATSCYQGEGLNFGMYLTKEIIAKHFGQMILKSNNDTNVFGFSIPIN